MQETFYLPRGLSESELSKYYLICKYSKKVSQRLLDEKKDLYEIGMTKGKVIFDDALHEQINRPSPFFEMVKRHKPYIEVTGNNDMKVGL